MEDESPRARFQDREAVGARRQARRPFRWRDRAYGQSQARRTCWEPDAVPFAGEAGGPRCNACMSPVELRFQDRAPDVDRSQVATLGSEGRSQEERWGLRSSQRPGSACIGQGVALPIFQR